MSGIITGILEKSKATSIIPKPEIASSAFGGYCFYAGFPLSRE